MIIFVFIENKSMLSEIVIFNIKNYTFKVIDNTLILSQNNDNNMIVSNIDEYTIEFIGNSLRCIPIEDL